ncbi:MAG: DUF4147 domain-containing protein [Pseudomonadota bacterium]
MTPEGKLRGLWQAGVDAVGGYQSVADAVAKLDAPDQIVAVGKAAGAMSQAALDQWPGTPTLVVTKDGHAEGLPGGVRIIEASHPVPDARSLTGGRAVLDCVRGLGHDSHLLLLVSGGASALAEAPVEGVTLDDLKALNAKLLAQGLDITAMNVERRKISQIKGGGLLRAFGGARADVLTISDVPGDDPAVIGSGIGLLPDAPDFRADLTCTASNAIARSAAAEAAVTAGLMVLSNEECLYDDVPALAAHLGPRIAEMERGVMIFGGEPTVHLPPNPGRGGRNQALALALAEAIAGRDDITLIVGGTDGTDGPTEAAGGLVSGSTWGPGAAEALAAADSGTFLEDKDALLITGPTGTNVMDLAIALRV